jgi:hypothetical protein
MTTTLAQALAYAARGWPVLPTRPDRGPCPDPPGKCRCKIPWGTEHGCHDATTDLGVIRAWWQRYPAANVAIRTGAPGPDVLDVDVRADGNGWAAFGRLKRAGYLTGAQALVHTPSSRLHLYFTGTGQPSGKLTGHKLDLKASGGYVNAPPSVVHGRPYKLIDQRDGTAVLDWQAACRLLEPPRFTQPRRHANGSTKSFDGVIRYLSGLKDGQQRWEQLHWGARRAAEQIAAGKLDEPTAREALMEAARANGYVADHGERQALRKIDRGLRDDAR